jgi:hypothetical protein
MTTNPRAVAGDNVDRDHAKDVSDRLSKDYAALADSVAAILAEARALPAEVTDQDSAGAVTAVIKRMRELDTRIDGIREAEKEPYLTSERAVDQFFFSLRERLARRKKTDQAGGADVLQARLHAYNEKREREERERREAAARAAREAEDSARRQREEQQRIADEAAAKAARARSEASRAAAADAAAAAAAAAAEARRVEDEQRQQRMTADALAQAKPADLVRERHAGGALNTMRQVPLVAILDPGKLDAVALWPFVKDDHKLMALKLWAKVSQYKKPMEGADIRMVNDTVVQ